MINLFLQIYQTFQQQQQIFINAGLEPVKYIDNYRGQPLNPQQFEYFPLPAIFIDWRISWEKTGKNYDGTLSLDFHVLSSSAQDTSSVADEHAIGLKNVVYHAMVRAILDNLTSPNTGRLQRVDENPITTEVINYHLLRYQCYYRDPMLEAGKYVDVLIEALKISGELIQKIN